MTTPLPSATAAPTSVPADPHTRALLLAAEAVLAHLHPRAPLRLETAALEGGVTYAAQPHAQALVASRALLEEVVMTALAQSAAARLLGLPRPEQAATGRDPQRLLASALTQPEEAEVQGAYLTVLEARARALLRRHWAEVQVVAAGLREHGLLDRQSVAHRVACAQGIRGTLLN